MISSCWTQTKFFDFFSNAEEGVELVGLDAVLCFDFLSIVEEGVVELRRAGEVFSFDCQQNYRADEILEARKPNHPFSQLSTRRK